MNKISVFRIIFLCGGLLLSCPAMFAQHTASELLEWTRQHLDNGDCEKARATYELYKDKVPAGDAEVEQRIDECGRSDDFVFNIKGVKYKMIHVEGGAFEIQEDPQRGIRESIYDTIVTEENGASITMVYTITCTSSPSSPQSPGKVVQIKDFYIGEFEVTQGLWFDVMGTTIFQQRDKESEDEDLYGVGGRYPMYYVNYYEAQQFCNKLNKLLEEKLPAGYGIALPTGNEWEYAAQGGNKSKSYKNKGYHDYSDVAGYKGNSNGSTNIVGSNQPNPLGLFDMSGNVSEWCDDRDDTKSTAMFRGDSFNSLNGISWFTANVRLYDLGFRLALVRR